jgi:hypothetical protein
MQSPTQWVPWALSPGTEQPGRELNTQLRLVPRVRKRDICIPSPIRLHGVVLNVTFAVRLDEH